MDEVKDYNDKCKCCIHKDVCAYREHYQDVVKLYEAALKEGTKYPYFRMEIYCCKYTKVMPVERGF